MGEAIRQHLIDPEICIRCNTGEETCPVKAITHDGRNYVVDAEKCNSCLACIAPCPTGAIDNWRTVLRAEAYGVAEQLTWDVLPGEKSLGLPLAPGVATAQVPAVNRGSTIAPRSASRAHVNLYTQREPAIATVVGNHRVTDA